MLAQMGISYPMQTTEIPIHMEPQSLLTVVRTFLRIRKYLKSNILKSELLATFYARNMTSCCFNTAYIFYVRKMYGDFWICYAKQKHPKCIKSKVKSEAPVSSYSYTRLKSVISGRGQGPSCLLATMLDLLHKNSRSFNLSQ